MSSNKDKDGLSYSNSKTDKESFSKSWDRSRPDHSLGYAEDDSDRDICNKITKYESSKHVQDTVQTIGDLNVWFANRETRLRQWQIKRNGTKTEKKK